VRTPLLATTAKVIDKSREQSANEFSEHHARNPLLQVSWSKSHVIHLLIPCVIAIDTRIAITTVSPAQEEVRPKTAPI
jgi:hypothetical protein